MNIALIKVTGKKTNYLIQTLASKLLIKSQLLEQLNLPSFLSWKQISEQKELDD